MRLELLKTELRQLALPCGVSAALVTSIIAFGVGLVLRSGQGKSFLDAVPQGMAFGEPVIMLLAVLLGGELISKDRQNGSLRFLLGHPVSPWEIYLAKHATQVLGLIVMSSPLLVLSAGTALRPEFSSVPVFIALWFPLALVLLALSQLVALFVSSGMHKACGFMLWVGALVHAVNFNQADALPKLVGLYVLSLLAGAWLFSTPFLRARTWLGGSLHWVGRRAPQGRQWAAAVVLVVLLGAALVSREGVRQPTELTDLPQVVGLVPRPGGSQLALLSSGPTRQGVVLAELADSGGSNARLFADRVAALSWLPSGECLVLRSQEDGVWSRPLRTAHVGSHGATLELLDADGRSVRTLLEAPAGGGLVNVAWYSPLFTLDAARRRVGFLVARGNEIVAGIVGLDDGHAEDFVLDLPLREKSSREPAFQLAGWDSVGRLVVVERTTGKNQTWPMRVHLLGLDSRVLEVDTIVGTRDFTSPSELSADGQYLVVEQILGSPIRPATSLWCVPLDGSPIRRLFGPGELAGWLVHPERGELVWAVGSDDEVRVERVSLPLGSRRALGPGPADWRPVNFSADGRWLQLRKPGVAANVPKIAVDFEIAREGRVDFGSARRLQVGPNAVWLDDEHVVATSWVAKKGNSPRWKVKTENVKTGEIVPYEIDPQP